MASTIAMIRLACLYGQGKRRVGPCPGALERVLPICSGRFVVVVVVVVINWKIAVAAGSVCANTSGSAAKSPVSAVPSDPSRLLRVSSSKVDGCGELGDRLKLHDY